MTEFKVGDEVRLKAKPELSGKISYKTADWGWAVTKPGQTILYRYPEELELVPRRMEIGSRVKHREFGNGEGTIISASEMWNWITVKWDQYGWPGVYMPHELEML